MDPAFSDFVHSSHYGAFVEAAVKYSCNILVRRTGRASLEYMGQTGYTGKRADMKAKTAKTNAGPYRTAGLVCSPVIHHAACAPDAMKYWQMSKHLITPGAFNDNEQPRGCKTPYMLQTNTKHKHYGCVAWVEYGLLAPRYVHGDYDLYAIIPHGYGRKVGRLPVKEQSLAATTMPSLNAMSLHERELHKSASTPDLVGPLTFQVANFLNVRIAKTEPGLLGALMVNHGEHINQGLQSHDYQEVLAFMPQDRGGVWAKILRNKAEHEAFYRDA